MDATEKQRVLFIGTQNRTRSQMAEGMLRHWASDRFEVYSAGTTAGEIPALSLKAMAEIGIDISGHESKTLDRYVSSSWDWIITMCDQARLACPVFPDVRNTNHWGFADPAEATGTEDERLAAFRLVRNEISGRLRLFVLAAENTTAADRAAMQG